MANRPTLEERPTVPRRDNGLAAALSHRWRLPRQTLRSARRYSRFVTFMKGLLPLAAIGVGGAVLFYASQHKDPGAYALTFERMGKLKDDLTMVHPRLTGTDDDGAPFVVTADSATQEDAKKLRVRLQNVRGNITLTDGGSLTLLATEGLLDGDAHTLLVSKGIQLTSVEGYEVRTAAAMMNIKTGIVHSDVHVTVDGPAGHIEADSFAADKNAHRASFKGHVHMLLNPKAQDIRP